MARPNRYLFASADGCVFFSNGANFYCAPHSANVIIYLCSASLTFWHTDKIYGWDSRHRRLFHKREMCHRVCLLFASQIKRTSSQNGLKFKLDPDFFALEHEIWQGTPKFLKSALFSDQVVFGISLCINLISKAICMIFKIVGFWDSYFLWHPLYVDYKTLQYQQNKETR